MRRGRQRYIQGVVILKWFICSSNFVEVNYLHTPSPFGKGWGEV